MNRYGCEIQFAPIREIRVSPRELLRNLQHAIVAAVADIKRAVELHVNAVRLVQLGLVGRATQTGRAFVPVACDADDLALLHKTLPDHVILGVGDDHVALKIEAKMLRTVQGSQARVAAIAARAALAGADDGPDFALRINGPQSVAASLQNPNHSALAYGDGARIDERRRDRIRAVFGNATLAVTRDRSDDARFQIDRADAPVVEVREVNVLPLRIERRAIDMPALRLSGQPAVSAEAFPTDACDGRDDSGFAVDLSDAAVPGVGDENVVIGSDREIVRPIDLGAAHRAAVAGKARRAVAAERRDNPVRGNFPNFVPVHLDDDHVARAVEIDAERVGHLGANRGRAVAFGSSSGDEDELPGGVWRFGGVGCAYRRQDECNAGNKGAGKSQGHGFSCEVKYCGNDSRMSVTSSPVCWRRVS